jgi:hypothetical protein
MDSYDVLIAFIGDLSPLWNVEDSVEVIVELKKD